MDAHRRDTCRFADEVEVALCVEAREPGALWEYLPDGDGSDWCEPCLRDSAFHPFIAWIIDRTLKKEHLAVDLEHRRQLAASFLLQRPRRGRSSSCQRGVGARRRAGSRAA